jgi:CTP synthase
LGICLGMQMAVIEYSRNVLNLSDANSTEMNNATSNPVISLMENQKNITEMGGTMRLGSWKCDLIENSLAKRIYSKSKIKERHRHRYELNFEYMDTLKSKGLIFSGLNPDTNLVEIIELENHPWFLGVQFHPEYKSTALNPHPVFISFVEASYKKKLNNGRK